MENNDVIGLNDMLNQFKEEGVNPQLDKGKFEEGYRANMEKKTPILVQVLMFVGALLAAGFFLGFLALLEIFRSEVVVMLMGVVVTGVAIAIPYKTQQETTIEPLGMAALIVGCSLFAIGYNEMMSYRGFQSFLIISALVSGIVVVIAGSHLQKISAVLCFNFCWYLLFWDWGFMIGFNFLVLLNALVITAAWLKEPELLTANSKLGQWYSAILNGCSVSMIGLLIGSVNIHENWHWDEIEVNPSYWWMSSILLVGLVLWTLHDTLDLVNERKRKIPILVGAGLALMILVQAPGIIAGILVLFLGIFSGYRLFVGQGILAIFFFTSMFYYNLNTSLLSKSMLMVGSGLIFMLIGYFLKKMHDRETALVQ